MLNSFKKYRNLNEEFNDAKAIKDAEEWLKAKYGEDLYKFKNLEGMDMNGENTKTYDIVVGENMYILNLKKFDSNGDGDADTVGFDVKPAIEPDEEEEEL